MSHYLQASWFRHVVLLAALTAGGLMTLAVPSYEEMAAANSQAAKSRSAPAASSHTPRDVTGVDLAGRRLNRVRSMN